MLLPESNRYADWIQPRRSRYLIIALISVVSILLVYPFQSTVVPVWRLKVVDLAGGACSGMQVNEGWGHYSLELQPTTGGEYLFTDKSGYVTFPERRTRASLIRRIVMPVITRVMVIAHGSTGIHAYVFASGMKNGTSLNYEPGKPMPNTILVERCYSDGG
jgi:hypothetical protein